jgi:uncharacterized repeat protein (TIGR04076 family)
MKINQKTWKVFQEHLGYTDDEMKIFTQDPRNADVVSKAPQLMNKTIVAEVVKSHGCNSLHKPGDKFYFDGAGNLLTRLCPKRVCFSALGSLTPLINTASELFYAGINPNDMRFKRTGCFDVGLHCGGWGNIVMEVKVEDRKKSKISRKE